MSRFRRLKFVLAAIAGLLAAGPSFADIKAFNTAMLAKDYKTAVAEAVAIWPGLDKSRDDIAIIAREFGFAAYLAGDYAAARVYGEAAVAGSAAQNEEPVLRASSDVLFRLADHLVTPTAQSRDALLTAINQRLADNSLDMITILAVEKLAAYDFEQLDWRNAAASAAIGEKLTAGAGPLFTEKHYRFALFRAAADYMANQNVEAYAGLSALKRSLIEAIAVSSSEEDAQALVRVYYETAAWWNTAQSHLQYYKRVRDWSADDASWKAYSETPAYKAAFAHIEKGKTPNACRLEVTDRSPMPETPSDGRFRDMIGTVIFSLNVSANGRVEDPQVLAVVPGKDFGDKILKAMPRMRFKRWAEGSTAGCSVEQTGYVFTMIYMID